MHCPFHPCLSETFARRSWGDGLRRGGSAASSPPESENNRVESCMPHCRERGEGGRE